MASEEKKKTLHELGIFQTRKPILSIAEDKQAIEKKKSIDKSDLLPPPSPSTKTEKENEEKDEESKKDEMTSSTISSGFSSGTINRRRREIVIPIRPTGETYRRGGSFKERNTDPKPLDLMSTSMIILPSEKRNTFVVPQISLPRDLRSTSPPSQKIVMRKKRTDSDCTADTVIIAPKVKQTAVKTIVSPSPPAKESVQLSIVVPKKPSAPSAETRREVEELRKKEEEVKREEKKEEERRDKLTDEVDALEAEIGRRLALISNKSEELAKNLEKTQSAPLSPSSTASMQVVKTCSSSTLPRSITTVTQPIDLLPSSLPPKKKDDKMSEELKPRSSSGNLATRVKESIADFTTGSTDRLQRWKSKLHSTGRRIREKDSSAPPPLVRTMQSSSPEVLVDWSVKPRPLHITRSASNAMTLHENSGMEHRTLKFSTQQPVYHNVHSMSRQSFNSDNLPPPARIVPFSGSRAHENSDIIRPIAYRAHGNEEMNRRPYPHKVELTKSALNLSTSGVAVSRPRAVFPSTSNSFSVVRHENEYDTVSDIIADKEKSNSDGGSDYCKFSASSGSNGGSIGNSRKTTSRQSTGAHITPSPSDSGIVDYETMIRDKENELADVRKTMEQNEEIIVKVYLEKERSWKDQLEQMRNRLVASEKGESALRMQVASLSRQTEAMSSKVEKMEDEKSRMAARIRDLESRECENCSSHLQQRHSPPSSGRPVPAPRTFKSASGTDLELRDEVSELRREVATLKDALQFIPESKRNAIYANNNSISLRDRLI